MRVLMVRGHCHREEVRPLVSQLPGSRANIARLEIRECFLLHTTQGGEGWRDGSSTVGRHGSSDSFFNGQRGTLLALPQEETNTQCSVPSQLGFLRRWNGFRLDLAGKKGGLPRPAVVSETDCPLASAFWNCGCRSRTGETSSADRAPQGSRSRERGSQPSGAGLNPPNVATSSLTPEF